MGVRIRALVAVLLTLISLSVLSLHVALCFHYPSALFAVTLLLNPSLWLFVGLLSMFCTLVLSYRDKRRKLVPALCTSCRPKNEASLRFSSRSRYDYNRWYQHPSCKCAERTLVACQYSSDSSVHTTTQLLSKSSLTSQSLVAETKESSTNLNLVDDENDSLLTFDDRAVADSRKKPEDVQNYSCLMKTFSVTETKGNTLVVLNKGSHPQNLYFDKETLKMFPGTHKCLASTQNSPQPVRECNLSGIKATVVIHNDKLSTTLDPDKVDSTSETSSSLPDTSDYVSATHPIRPSKDYSLYRSRNRIISQRIPLTSEGECKPLIRNRCTCPRGYFTAYGSYNTHFPIVTKSNKPIMKCTKIFRHKTPTHLFQVKNHKEGDATENDGKGNVKNASTNQQKNEVSSESDFPDMAREPDTFSSIVSLLD